MRKVRGYLLMGFEEERKPMNVVVVPKGSKLLSCKALSDGINVFYEIPSEDIKETRADKFRILEHYQVIPDNAEFVSIIDFIVGEENNQKVIILPIYKLF